MLHATRGLSLAALLALCLVHGLGDVDDASPLRLLYMLPWLVVGLVVLSVRAWPPRSLTLPVLAWLGVLVLSALLAPAHRADALSTLTRPLSGVLLAWAVFGLTPTPARWKLVCATLALGGAGVALVGLSGLSVPAVGVALAALHDTNVPIADVPRLTATLSHPNVAAIVLELTLPLTVGLALSAPRWRMLAVALVLAQLVALTLTFSRAGILAGAASLAVLAAIAARRGVRRAVVPVGLAALVGPLALAIGSGAMPQVERRLVAEMEQEGYRATYNAPAEVAAAPEQVLEVPVRVTNASTSEWSPRDDSRVALGYHLLRSDGTPIEFDCPATLLPAEVPPNTSLDVVARVHAPAIAGAYLIEWDALREGVAWFSWRGSPTEPMHLLVSPSTPLMAASPPDPAVALPRPARVQYWAAAMAMLRDQPLLGVGPDNFRLRFAEYSGIEESHIGTHAHSLYLEALADTGVVGLVGLLAVLVALLRLGWRGLSSDTHWLWRAALLASLVGWLVHGLLDDFERFWPAHVAYWIIVGLLVSGARLGQRAHRAE